MKNTNDNGKIIGGLLIGAVIGGTLSLLFAPKSGKETRRKLLRRSDEIGDHVKLKFYSFLESMKKKLESATDKANEMMKIERALNAKILKLTLKISDEYPELYPFIEEMSVTIPDDTDPEISLKILQAYYDSLESMISKYIKDHQAATVLKADPATSAN